jgi:hypothetical protein
LAAPPVWMETRGNSTCSSIVVSIVQTSVRCNLSPAAQALDLDITFMGPLVATQALSLVRQHLVPFWRQKRKAAAQHRKYTFERSSIFGTHKCRHLDTSFGSIVEPRV